MVPPEVRQQPHVSFTQLDTYLRCPLKYRFSYIDRIPPDFTPAALAFGSGIHGAIAYFFRQQQKGQAPGIEDLQAYFEGYWQLETGHRVIRYPEKESKETLLALAGRMLEVFYAKQEPGAEVVGVEVPFEVPLVDQETGELLDRPLVGSLDLLERGSDGRLVVVDIKTASRKYTEVQASYCSSFRACGAH